MTLWTVTDRSGATAIVDAATIATIDGVLVLTDTRGAVVRALAPGSWRSVHPVGSSLEWHAADTDTEPRVLPGLLSNATDVPDPLGRRDAIHALCSPTSAAETK